MTGRLYADNRKKTRGDFQESMTMGIDNRRIAKNTAFLYVRMIVIMLVSLFTSRVVLETLGVEDFGIYSMVGGIVAISQIISNTLTDTTQRYLTFEIGKGDNGNPNKVFSTCLLLHFIWALIIIAVIEPVGLWFLRCKLLIPADRLVASEWLFQFSVISMFVMYISIPYNALIIAHEHMKTFAGISIIETSLKLVLAYSLSLNVGIDKLILYGLLMLLLQIVMRFIYGNYSVRHFKEAHFHWCWDRHFIREMGCFASWTIIGSTAYIGITHGINLLLGMFFMPAVSAARGLAVQVENAVKMFTRNFQTAINPQITKSYASGQVEDTNRLMFRGARFSSFLLQLPTLPILFETETILRIWLPEVPPYTIIFIRMILIIAWVNCLGNSIAVAAKATGNIRRFELYAASIKLMVIPAGYICLKSGCPPQSVFIAYLLCEIIALGCNVYITHQLTGFSLINYYTDVILPTLRVAAIAVIVPAGLRLFIVQPSILRLLFVASACVIGTLVSVYFAGISNNERNIIKSNFHKMLANE